MRASVTAGAGRLAARATAIGGLCAAIAVGAGPAAAQGPSINGTGFDTPAPTKVEDVATCTMSVDLTEKTMTFGPAGTVRSEWGDFWLNGPAECQSTTNYVRWQQTPDMQGAFKADSLSLEDCVRPSESLTTTSMQFGFISFDQVTMKVADLVLSIVATGRAPDGRFARLTATGVSGGFPRMGWSGFPNKKFCQYEFATAVTITLYGS